MGEEAGESAFSRLIARAVPTKPITGPFYWGNLNSYQPDSPCSNRYRATFSTGNISSVHPKPAISKRCCYWHAVLAL